jgi:hypothetical protein
VSLYLLYLFAASVGALFLRKGVADACHEARGWTRICKRAARAWSAFGDNVEDGRLAQGVPGRLVGKRKEPQLLANPSTRTADIPGRPEAPGLAGPPGMLVEPTYGSHAR